MNPAHPAAAFLVTLGLALPTAHRAEAAAPSAADTLRVMTFNVMYEPARAGGGLRARWPLIVELLQDAEADVIGLQEVMTGRVEPLRQALPEYRVVVSAPAGIRPWPSPFMIALLALAAGGALALVASLRRRRGRRWRLAALAIALVGAGTAIAVRLALVGSIGMPREHLALAYRPDRLRLVAAGTLWLSSTPSRPYSHGTFDSGPHIAYVASFIRIPGGQRLTIMNVHVGHSPLERARAGRILRGWLDARWDGAPQLLLGDFNATPENPLLRDLRATRPAGAPGLRDAWLEAERRHGPAATYHWTRPARDFLPLRLDYVLERGALRVTNAAVIGRARGAAVASDHDALVVDLELP